MLRPPKQRYEACIFERINETRLSFKLTVIWHLKEQKSTKETYSDEIIGRLVDKMWVKFLKDCKNPKIGVTKALEIAFK